MRFVRAPDPVSYADWRPRAYLLGAVGAVVLGLCAGLLLTVLRPAGPLARYEYHLWRWEAETILSSAFSRLGVGPDPSDAKADEALRQYFRLTSDLRSASDEQDPDLRLLESIVNERATYENDVERTIERRIQHAVGAAGLRRPLPLFNDVRIVWPPVDLELTSPPRLLVRSPRNEIRRSGDTLLTNDLSVAQIQQIEESVDNEDTVSLVVSVGGIAAYPAILRDDRSYDALLETAAHEWVHHYLAFYPLGEQWGKGGDAETLNETTADLAGEEIARLVREQHPVEFPPGESGANPRPTAPTVDFTAEMRRLRQEVDALLKAGQVGDAEQLMEERRLYLAANGINIRKINQAYFAFYGTYAESPASSSPIGPKVRRVWEMTGDVGTFLALMREVRTATDLDEILESLGKR